MGQGLCWISKIGKQGGRQTERDSSNRGNAQAGQQNRSVAYPTLLSK
jgi:hypothetical protein